MENTIMHNEKFTVIRTKEFKKNDIVVFDYYGNDYGAGTILNPGEKPEYPQHWEKRVFRLIAASGDNLEIKNDSVFINGIHSPLPPTGKIVYYIEGPAPSPGEIAGDDIEYSRISGDTAYFSKPLTDKEIRELKENGRVYSAKVYEQVIGYEETFARLEEFSNWTPQNYGPLQIPAPGETIQITEHNYWMFHNIPGIQHGQLHTIKEPLYFVMGDNRNFSEDSRYIGLISHSNMYGRVKL